MIKKLSFLFLLIAALLLANPIQPTAALEDNACVVLVLDESGSMVDNDPGYLRNTGAKLLIGVLDEGDSVGLVRFSTTAQRLTDNLVTLQSPQDKHALLELLQDSVPEGYTDLQAALTEASHLLNGATCGSSTIVLLSDGYPQLESGLPADYIAQTIALVNELNVPTYGIALTAEGESGLLYQLASATDNAGLVIPARTASDLLDAYLDVISHLKDRTVIGDGYTQAPGNVSLPLEPGLAQYVSRVTYIVSKPAGVSAQLIAPGGEIVDENLDTVVFAYTNDPRFAAYTVENSAPGDWVWRLDGSGQVQARAILRSQLRIETEQPSTYHGLGIPMPIAASLIEEEANGTLTTLIGQTSFSVFITRPDGSQDELDRLYDDGSHGDALAGDGRFSNQYVKTDLPGEYTITLTGYKGVIPATRTLRVLVVPFPQIEVLSPAGPNFEFRGEPMPLGMNLVDGNPPTLDSGSFVAEVITPSGEMSTVPLTADENGTWTGTYVPAADGNYEIVFHPQDATYKGAAFTLTAGKTVDVQLVPTIRFALTQSDIVDVEAKELAQGLPLVISATSSSPTSENVQFEIAGIPALTVEQVSPASLPPGESSVYVTLKGPVDPGEYEGKLLPMVREGVDLTERELPFPMLVYEPALLAEPQQLNIQVRHDRQGKEELFLTITSTSLKDETVALDWNGPENLELVAEPAVIPAGEAANVPFRFTGDLSEGSYQGEITLNSRDGVSLQPGAIPVALRVTPVPWCARWCLTLGAGSVAMLVAAAVVRGRLKKRPRTHGMLVPIKTPSANGLPDPLPAPLSGRGVIIGSGKGANVHLVGGGVQAKHASVRAEEQLVTERIGNPPQLVEMKKMVNVVRNLGDGLVKVNGSLVVPGQDSVALQPGARISIGEYEFIYRL